MRKLLTSAAAVLAAVAVFLLLTLPPLPTRASGEPDAGFAERVLAGAYHVHSTVSDGSGSREAIAAAAARAGLRFVIFTDHGDGRRPPEPPRYIDGVLCLDGVEISTNGGHYVALDMRPAEFPLGGEAAAVVEDVRRLGGFGIAAHPLSPKPSLAWSDWSAPVDGLEWLNADSEWRDEPLRRLARLPFDYLFRRAAAVAATLDRPEAAIARLDELSRARPVVALAAHDAHGGIGAGGEEGSWPGLRGIPSYEASFRAFALSVIVASPPTRTPAADARLVLDAIRRGRVFSAISGAAAPAVLDFRATAAGEEAHMGDVAPFARSVALTVRSSLPPGGEIVLVCDGQEVARSPSAELRYEPDRPSACRPEVVMPGAPGTPPVPWIFGNAIHLVRPSTAVIGPEPIYESSVQLEDVAWVVEKDAGSQGSASPADGGMRLQYQLKPPPVASQYVAAVAALPAPLPDFNRIIFTGEAGAPMRVSVQLRFDGGGRWARSVYLEPDPRRVVISAGELVAAEAPTDPRPDLRRATSILFVVDLVNALPGASGWLRISGLSFGRSS